MEKPENLIPEEKMVAILYDLAIINAAKSTNPHILDENEITVMNYLYDKHGIDSVQFVSSDAYYASLPARYEAIYKQVETSLDKDKRAMEEARKSNNDSIRKATEKQRVLDARSNINKNKKDTLP